MDVYSRYVAWGKGIVFMQAGDKRLEVWQMTTFSMKLTRVRLNGGAGKAAQEQPITEELAGSVPETLNLTTLSPEA